MHLRGIDANLLVVFDALLVNTSVTQTAEQMGRSPSAISHALARLRELFADALFVRAGQRLVPTAKARELAPTVHVIVAGMESLLRPHRPFDPAVEIREFTLAASEIHEVTLLQPLRELLAREAPGFSIAWTAPRDGDVTEDLRSGRVHLAIAGEGSEFEAPDLRVVPLLQDRLVTLARPRHPLARKPPSAKAFAAADHIRVASLDTIDKFDARLAGKGLRCNARLQASSAYAALVMALETGYLVSLPASLAERLKAHLRFAQVTQPFAPVFHAVRLAWHVAHERDEAHGWLADQIRQLVAAPETP